MDAENPYSPPTAPLDSAGSSRVTRSRPRAAAGKLFELPCECGRRIRVTAADAGTRVACECGVEQAVPSLSRLRQLEGRDPYEAGTVDTICRLVSCGELPQGENCAVSGRCTQDVLGCSVIISSVMLHEERMAMKILLSVFVSPLFFWIPKMFVKYYPAPGSETTVPTPIRLASRYHARYSKASQSRLRRLLRRVPIYRTLLDQYPLAQIVVSDASSPQVRHVI
jgi:hypothetical protein